MLRKILENIENKNWDNALTLCKQLLDYNPENPDIWQLLGIISFHKNNHTESIFYFDKALSYSQPNHIIHYNLAKAYEKLDNQDKTLYHLRQALKYKPDFTDAINDTAIILYKKGLWQQALDLYSIASNIDPYDEKPVINLALHHMAQKQFDETISILKNAILKNTKSAPLYFYLGNALDANRELENAISAYELAIRNDSKHYRAYVRLAEILIKNSNFDLAIEAYKKATELYPNNAELHNKAGMACICQGNLDMAAYYFNKAIEIDPNNTDAYINLAMCYLEIGYVSHTIRYCQKALEIDSKSAEAYNVMSIACLKAREISKAIRISDHALSLYPDMQLLHSNHLLALHYDPDLKPDQILKAHYDWGKKIQTDKINKSKTDKPETDNSKTYKIDKEPDPNRTIKIGYMSPDFIKHSVAYFILPLLANHDSNRFKIYGYSRVKYPDEITEKCKSFCHEWRNIWATDIDATISIIKADQIDIMVDLAGHTCPEQMQLMSEKVAPIQLTYLGYPNSTGLQTIDYRLTDNIADPIGTGNNRFAGTGYNETSEKLLRLPDGFLCYRQHHKADVAPYPPIIEKKFCTFGSFNMLGKTNDCVISVWSEILKAVPHSRLIIKYKELNDSQVCNDILHQFEKNGIHDFSTRIVLMGSTKTVAEHLARYDEIDIALDTFPYNGTTTTCDALWMGVPVVTLAGDRHSGRVGASILSCVGLVEWIAETPKDYISIAVKFANQPETLRLLRETLREKIRLSSLCNEKAFARKIEKAYLEIWQKWCEQNKMENTKNTAQPLNDLGISYVIKQQFEDAKRCFEQALVENQDDTAALVNLGALSIDQGQLTDGIEYCMKAAEKSSVHDAYVFNNIGFAFYQQGDIKKAISFYQRALKLEPKNPKYQSNLLNALNYDHTLGSGDIYSSHLQWGDTFCKTIQQYEHNPKKRFRSDETRLKVGYVSGDFYRHSVSFFFEPILACHDRNAFDIYCYSNVRNEDDITKHFQSYPVQWKNILKFSDSEAAELIYSDKIDILVDLGGHTPDSRLRVFAYKPAPIQVTYLGYPNTTGLKTIDYRLTDSKADPYESDDHEYTETLIRLPNLFLCYAPLNNAPKISSPICKNGYCTFGSFNMLPKINLSVISSWSKILNSVRGSRLFLKNLSFKDKATRNIFIEKFNRYGIDSDRIELAGYIPAINDHLELYERIDIALDTFPYNGTTTTCEALLMGVPVITLRGNSHASRVGVSLLSALHLDGFIAENEDMYVELASMLAKDVERLKNIKQFLRDHIMNSSLCNAKAFTKSLEKTYINFWEKYLNKQ